MKRFQWSLTGRGRGGLWFLIPLLVTCGPAPTSWTGIPADDAQVPEVVRELYRDDAARLALRQLTTTGGGSPEEVELPAERASSLYQALIRVYNIPDLAARDSVVTLYRIHTWPTPAVRYLSIGVDSLASWLAAWQQGHRLTGYSAIDRLMDTFALDRVGYYRLAHLGFHWVTLRSGRPLNIAALAPYFVGIDGVRVTEPVLPNGGGDDIEVAAQEGGWRLDYSVGYGDCPAGCGARRYWTFDVYPDGRVTYRGSRGAPPPPLGVRP